MGRPSLTTEDWKAAAIKAHGDKYDYSQAQYRGYGCQIAIVCPNHGVFHQRENNHRNGNGCPKCGVQSRREIRSHGFDSFVAAANALHNYRYDYPDQTILNSRTKARILCPVHGAFEQMVYKHLAGNGCAKCGYEANGAKSQIGVSEFLRRAKEVHGDTYEYVSNYYGMHKNVRIRCPLHGEFSQTPSNHIGGAGCPSCVGRISKGETELGDFVESLGFTVSRNDTSVMGKYEIDIYVPDKRIGIEYNGLWFHREQLVGNKTRTKWEQCDLRGVTLVQVFEDEWKFKRPMVEARLRAILGVSDVTYARKCKITQPDTKSVRVFLEATHTQGVGAGYSCAYGLEIGGQLVAVATFGKGRFTHTGWELLRYASVGRVLGGISKLVHAFRKDYPDGDLVSYADLRWGNGEAYRAAGFRLVGVTESDYWWAHPTKLVRHSRYSLQKSKTGLPEKVYAERNGLVKVLGVGHKKWVWAK
jgi:hypothetical protein